MKTRNLLLALGVSAALLTLESIGHKKTACETYQGHGPGLEDNIIYAFDPLPPHQRIGQARYRLAGNVKLKDSLLSEEAIGKRFCFTYMDPISPIGYKVIRSISPDTSQTRVAFSDREK